MIPACVKFEAVFSPNELQAMRIAASALEHRPATTEDADTAHRAGQVAWWERGCRLCDSALPARIDTIMREVNAAHFRFDLTDLSELQFARYCRGDHFGWHTDMRHEGAPRKLALIVGLSDPRDYDGGTLEVEGGNQRLAIQLTSGDMVALPAWTLHRVTPVSSGVRRTLVAWGTGPQFR